MAGRRTSRRELSATYRLADHSRLAYPRVHSQCGYLQDGRRLGAGVLPDAVARHEPDDGAHLADRPPLLSLLPWRQKVARPRIRVPDRAHHPSGEWKEQSFVSVSRLPAAARAGCISNRAVLSAKELEMAARGGALGSDPQRGDAVTFRCSGAAGC